MQCSVCRHLENGIANVCSIDVGAIVCHLYFIIDQERKYFGMPPITYPTSYSILWSLFQFSACSLALNTY